MINLQSCKGFDPVLGGDGLAQKNDEAGRGPDQACMLALPGVCNLGDTIPWPLQTGSISADQLMKII